jgi:glycine dehydrogenase subunit 1
VQGNPLKVHPYVPNSAAAVRSRMLDEVGVDSIEELFAAIPAELRMSRPLQMPPPLRAEADLTRHVEGILERNRSTKDHLSFLGSGCYMHYVPEVCSEINGRGEFLTAYAGEPYEDHGKWQAIYEYVSLMADLLEMDVVNVPTYDGFQAASTSLRMAGRITGRPRVLILGPIDAAKYRKIEAYLEGALDIEVVEASESAGVVELSALRDRLNEHTAAVYLETPNLYGIVDTGLTDLARAAHDAGALVVCYTEPLSLGFQRSPATWGADIVCGDIQSLGLGMHFGGANGGFIAVHDDERFVFQLPSRLFGLAPTSDPNELGFTDVAYERTSLARREEGVEWVGTAAALWGITAAVYLSLMGPQGLDELGRSIAARTRYAMDALSGVSGLAVLHTDVAHWREFGVEFQGKTVEKVNAALLERGIFGGARVPSAPATSREVAIYCVTELHTKQDIDQLVTALREVLS